MTTISAENILASENAAFGTRIVTLRLTYPRFIHAEVMTHRCLSRNAASSRAIPVMRMIERVANDPAVPLHWGRNEKGMQASREIDEVERQVCIGDWRHAMHDAVRTATALAERGVHKQVVNRLLEPFAHITVVATATLSEWESVLALRAHSAAEPHFQMLAREIDYTIYNEVRNAQKLQIGEWHLPFARAEDGPLFERMVLSIARCAATSYDTVDGYTMDYERARRIVKSLKPDGEPWHMSPFEHQACAYGMAASRNFSGGWSQLREMIETDTISI